MKKKQGISLIVLVITIIVMIILAASVVISLSNTGIINKAGQAVNATNEQQIRQMVDLAWAEAYAEGMRNPDDIKQYIETSLEKNKININEYNVIVTSNGVELKQGYSAVLIEGTTEMYNNKLMIYRSESIEYDVMEVEGNKLKVVTNLGKDDEETFEFDIVKGLFSFDVINIKEIWGESEDVYAVIFNSQRKLIKNISGEFGYDEYIIAIIENEEQLEIVKSGNYYYYYSFWVSGHYGQTELKTDDLVGTYGITTGIYGYKITRNGIEIYNSTFYDDNFAAAKSLVTTIMNDPSAVKNDYSSGMEITTSEYTVIAYKGLFHKDNALMYERYLGDNSYVYDFENTRLNKVIYDILDVNNRPIGVRTKGTNEYTNFDYRAELDSLTSSEQEEWIRNHEYYVENKYHALMPGEKYIID